MNTTRLSIFSFIIASVLIIYAIDSGASAGAEYFVKWIIGAN